VRRRDPAGDQVEQRADRKPQPVGSVLANRGAGRLRVRDEVVVGAAPVARELEVGDVERARAQVGEVDVDVVEPVEVLEDLWLALAEVDVEAVTADGDLVAVAEQEARGRERVELDIGGAAAARQPALDAALLVRGEEKLARDNHERDERREADQESPQSQAVGGSGAVVGVAAGGALGTSLPPPRSKNRIEAVSAEIGAAMIA